MKLRSKRSMLPNIALACCLILLAVPDATFAGCRGRSATTGASGRRGAPEAETQAEKARQLAISYDMGKRIMEGKVQLRSRVPELVSYQTKVLQRHVGRGSSDDVNQVLGRLSNAQLVAVRDYLDIKYPLSTVSEEELRQARFQKAKLALANE